MDNYGGISTGTAFFGLTADLYDENGLITSSDVTSPRSPSLGVPQIGLDSGETFNVEIDISTSSQNVENYSINLVMLAGYPIP
jgi:hypothetical protein